jgi:hypothetical protein
MPSLCINLSTVHFAILISNLEEQNFDKLVFPTKTHPSERKHLFTLLRQCSSERRQEVLDEIERAACKNKLRAGIVPFAHYLIAAIQNDQFLPNLGVEVSARREEAAIAQKTIAAMHHRTESRVNTEVVEELSKKARALILPGIMEKFEAYWQKEGSSQGQNKE